LFVDFKREQLGTTPDHRGSLFSHQELAIAAFINIEVAAFQEAGVKVGDGLIHFLQANAIQFSNRTGLPALIIENIQRRGWNSSWRRELVIKRVPQQYTESKERLLSGMMVDSRFFHIDVHNLHKEKLATNCYVYLEKAKRLPDTEIPIKTTEFKWAGVGFPGVAIMPRSTRAFDAFHIRVAEPTQIIFNALTDSSDFYPKLPKGPAKYELTYIIVAENFPPTRGTFILDLKESIGLTTFIEKC
jgi:hypothetical protein